MFKNVKKIVYIFLSVVLWLLLSLLVHIFLEMLIIKLIMTDFEKYSFGLDWRQILIIHNIYTVILASAGLVLGVWIGFKWWKYIYIDKKGGLIRRLEKN